MIVVLGCFACPLVFIKVVLENGGHLWFERVSPAQEFVEILKSREHTLRTNLEGSACLPVASPLVRQR
jgi:hypothetical protein